MLHELMKPVVGSDSATCISDLSKCYVQPNVNPVGRVNASHTYVKTVVGSDADVKQSLSENISHADVNPDC